MGGWGNDNPGRVGEWDRQQQRTVSARSMDGFVGADDVRECVDRHLAGDLAGRDEASARLVRLHRDVLRSPPKHVARQSEIVHGDIRDDLEDQLTA